MADELEFDAVELAASPENASKAKAAIDQVLSESNPMPDAEPPPDTRVQLPGGLVKGEDVISTAEVKELTGIDEEHLVRAAQSVPDNVFHFVNVLLECGVLRFGSEDAKETKRLLKTTLVGDRDALILGIRRATYGDDIDIEKWRCPECENESDLTIPLSDIPVREMKDPVNEVVFEVDLRKGRKAQVRLANGEDQLAVFENRRLTKAERDTMLLQRCLMSIIDADGTEHVTVGLGGSYARGMSIPDRHSILRALAEKQPGPQFNELKITHETCGKEVNLVIGIGDLFRDFILV
jgi:hypothetical protein